jgi:hypothetical protein
MKKFISNDNFLKKYGFILIFTLFIACPGDIVPNKVPSFELILINYNQNINIHNFHYLIQYKDSISIDFAVDTVYYYSNPTEQTAFFKEIDINNDFDKTIFIKGYYGDSLNNLDTTIFDSLNIGNYNYEMKAIIGKFESGFHTRTRFNKFNYNFGLISDTIYTYLTL